MFKKQIGHDMKVYVDDLLIKSKELTHHIVDMQDVFVVLQQN